MEKTVIHIGGMHCASCSSVVEYALSGASGVISCSVSLADNTATVVFDPNQTTQSDLEKIITKQGYKIITQNDNESDVLRRYYLRGFIISLFLTLPVATTMFVDGTYSFVTDTFFMVAAMLVVFGAGRKFHEGFFTKILRGHMNMDALISISTLIAIIYSMYAYYVTYRGGEMIHFYHFLEGAQFIITFILLGKYLELKSKGSASRAIASLMQLQAKQATVIRDNQEQKISIDDVVLNDLVVVRAGEKIPVDGVVEKGSCTVDEAMLTGESIPIAKKIGDEAFSGTIVNDGLLHIRVTKTSDQTVLAGIMQSVRDAQASKPPIQHVVDAISRVFVPCILVIAALAYVLHSQGMMVRLYDVMGITVSDWGSHALLVAVSTIVIACPCAMGLATPMAITVATGTGAKRGILIKTGEVLETSKAVSMVFFDKTGTLTQGKPQLTDVLSFVENKNTKENHKQILHMIQGVVHASHHPLSRAVVDDTMSIDDSEYEDVREYRGKGMVALYRKKLLYYGNLALLENDNIQVPNDVLQKISTLQDQGKTVNYVAYDGKIRGIVAVRDNPKKSAQQAIQHLHQQGIQTMMISGDNDRTVAAIAKEIGIETYFARVRPEQKASLVQKAQKQGEIVAFVGDGINDAPALAQANVGVAIGHGTDVAIETAQMVVVSGDPLHVAHAIKLARKTYTIIRQNLFWAFAYNTILVPIAALGLLMPWFASLAMSLSSVSVIANSLRIKKYT